MKVYKKYFIEGVKKAKGVVVIIDIFRTCSTASYMLGNGASRIIVARTAKQSFELKKENPKYILAGENKGVKIKGFDFGNSPTEINKIDFSEKTVILKTTSGTQGIICSKNASEVILGSFTTAGAIRKYFKKINPETVTLVCIGDSNKRRNPEDCLYADYLESKIKGGERRFDEIKDNIYKSENAKDLLYPEKDFEYCLALDKFNFIMKAENEDNQIIIRKKYIT